MRLVFSQQCILPLILILILAGCDSHNSSGATLSKDFESGSIGTVINKGANDWDLYLANDNNNDQLPDNYRTWWYVKLTNIDSSRPLKLNVKNRGFNYYYLPVFSYDQKTWHRFNESEVTQLNDPEVCNDPNLESPVDDNCSLTINSDRLSGQDVYIARFYPYTYTDLSNYLDTIRNHECVTVESLGLSPHLQQEIPLITIRCPDSVESQLVWLHARTHPAETGSSFLLEGAIDQLLTQIDQGRRDVVYYIAPMHNIDGVIHGNYRTNMDSINLETSWFFDVDSLPYLTIDAPIENQFLIEKMRQLNASYSQQGIIAINLHSSNSPPEQKVYAFPHFGDDGEVYSDSEINLWNNSNHFLELLNIHYDSRVDTTASGGSAFLNYFYPETWWWRQRQENALAMTLETTYGKAGYDHWVTEADLRTLGKSFTLSVFDYHDDIDPLPLIQSTQQTIKTPHPRGWKLEVDTKQ